MRELQQKQKLKSRLYSIPALLVLALFTIFVAKGMVGVIQKEQESAADVQMLKTKLTTLSTEQSSMKDDIASLNTQAGVDEEIKEKFNVSEPGEHVAILVDPTTTGTSSATSTDAWYKRVWDDIMSAL
jgi:cell division protein FtsB